MLRSLAGKPVNFWEHLMFDEEKNQVLGGHEGGSAGFSMARKDVRPKLRSTQYDDFRFLGAEGYEMRIATGRSVDTPPRPVHFEHTIVEPDAPLN